MSSKQNQKQNQWSATILPPLIPLVVLTGAIELLVGTGWVQEFILPRPSSVVRTIIIERNELLSALLETSIASFVGLILSFVVGSAFAVVLSLSTVLRRAFLPYAVFFQTVPIISIAPLLVIWFGFGQPTVIASAFIVSVFPVISSSLLGIQSTEPALIDLFRLYEASRWDHMWKLRLPFALPHLFSGLRIAAGLAVIGAIVGEFIGGGGLGAMVDAARTQQRIDLVFAAVLMSSLLGLVLVGAIHFASWLVLRRWHASAQTLN